MKVTEVTMAKLFPLIVDVPMYPEPLMYYMRHRALRGAMEWLSGVLLRAVKGVDRGCFRDSLPYACLFIACRAQLFVLARTSVSGAVFFTTLRNFCFQLMDPETSQNDVKVELVPSAFQKHIHTYMHNHWISTLF